MAASCPVRLSIGRGIAGFSLLFAALVVFYKSIPLFFVLMAGSLYFFKGCPACWVASLFDAIALKKQMRQAESQADEPVDKK